MSSRKKREVPPEIADLFTSPWFVEGIPGGVRRTYGEIVTEGLQAAREKMKGENKGITCLDKTKTKQNKNGQHKLQK